MARYQINADRPERVSGLWQILIGEDETAEWGAEPTVGDTLIYRNGAERTVIRRTKLLDGLHGERVRQYIVSDQSREVVRRATG